MFNKFLCDDFKTSKHPMPENIRKARNTGIIIGFVELFLSLSAFAFYARRRSRLILGLIIMTILFTILGFIVKVRLSWCGLLIHALYTISVIGGFYIYIFIDYFATNDASEREKIAEE